MNLLELQQKIAAREALRSELEELSKRESELRERLRRETLNLGYEQSDVEELEKKGSIKSIFFTLIGKREERLQKEEDEVDAARQQLESTTTELENVGTRIKRINAELRGIAYAETKYKQATRDLMAQIEAVKPLMSDADAGTLAIIRRELEEMDVRLSYYQRVTETGRELMRSVASFTEALGELVRDRRSEYESFLAVHEQREEVEARRRLALLAAERFSEVLSEDAELVGDRRINSADLDSTFQRAMIRTYSNAPAADRFVPDVPSLGLNTAAILDDVEKRNARLERHRADMTQRLSELLEKYRKV